MEPSCVKLYLALAMAVFFFLSELVASHVTHSLVLLSCAYQMFYNVLAIALLVLSYHVSRERSLQNSFGWVRLEVLGALVNLLFQMALCFAISVAAIQTMVHASHEKTEPRWPLLLLCFGILGLAVHTVCYLVIHTRHKNRRGCNVGIVSGTDVQVNFVMGDDTTEEACQLSPERVPLSSAMGESSTVPWQECASEALRTCGGCLLLMACAVAVRFGNEPLPRYVDPVLAIVAVLVLVCTSYPRMKESGFILLQNMPENVDMDTLQKKLLEKFPAIINVHEFHLWQLTNTQLIATVHIAVDSESAYSSLAGKVSRFLKEQGIALPTVQPEFCKGDHTASPCILRCSKGKTCGTLTCCGEGHDEVNGAARRRNKPHEKVEQTQQQLQAPLLHDNRASSALHLDESALQYVDDLQETDV